MIADIYADGANLTGANLSGATLIRTRLSGVKIIDLRNNPLEKSEEMGMVA